MSMPTYQKPNKSPQWIGIYASVFLRVIFHHSLSSPTIGLSRYVARLLLVCLFSFFCGCQATVNKTPSAYTYEELYSAIKKMQMHINSSEYSSKHHGNFAEITINKKTNYHCLRILEHRKNKIHAFWTSICISKSKNGATFFVNSREDTLSFKSDHNSIKEYKERREIEFLNLLKKTN